MENFTLVQNEQKHKVEIRTGKYGQTVYVDGEKQKDIHWIETPAVVYGYERRLMWENPRKGIFTADCGVEIRTNERNEKVLVLIGDLYERTSIDVSELLIGL